MHRVLMFLMLLKTCILLIIVEGTLKAIEYTGGGAGQWFLVHWKEMVQVVLLDSLVLSCILCLLRAALL